MRRSWTTSSLCPTLTTLSLWRGEDFSSQSFVFVRKRFGFYISHSKGRGRAQNKQIVGLMVQSKGVKLLPAGQIWSRKTHLPVTTEADLMDGTAVLLIPEIPECSVGIVDVH